MDKEMMQAKCSHSEIYSSTVYGPNGVFTNAHCLDCGKAWRGEGELYTHVGSSPPSPEEK